MKIPTSSSAMLLATLAVSSSSPALGAPTAEVRDNGLTSSSSNTQITSRRSSVSYPPPDAVVDLEGRGLLDGLLGGILCKIVDSVPPLKPLTASLGLCTADTQTALELTPEQEATVNEFANVIAAVVQSPPHLTPTDTPAVPPNTPDVSSLPTSAAQRREAQFFTRRGVSAAQSPSTASAPSRPYPPAPPAANAAPPAPGAAPAQPPNPADTPVGQIHPPVNPQAPAPPSRRFWASRSLPDSAGSQIPDPMSVAESHLPRAAPINPEGLPVKAPVPVPQTPSTPDLPVKPSPPAIPQAGAPGLPITPPAAPSPPIVPAGAQAPVSVPAAPQVPKLPAPVRRSGFGAPTPFDVPNVPFADAPERRSEGFGAPVPLDIPHVPETPERRSDEAEAEGEEGADGDEDCDDDYVA